MGKHRKPGLPYIVTAPPKSKPKVDPDNESTQELNVMRTPRIPFFLMLLLGLGLFYMGARDAFK